MKALLISAAMCFALLATARAETREVPQGNSARALATSDYGGVSISTITFSTATTFLGSGQYVIHGVVFSSGSTSAYVLFRDTDTSNENQTDRPMLRLYNVANATGVFNAGSNGGGFVGTPYPAVFSNGVAWHCSDASLNLVTVYYHKQQ